MFNIIFFIFCYFFVGFVLSLPYIYLKDKINKLRRYNPYNLPPFEIMLIAWPAFWIMFPVIILMIIQYKIKNS